MTTNRELRDRPIQYNVAGEEDSVSANAIAVLQTADADKKALKAIALGKKWQNASELVFGRIVSSLRPARPSRPVLLAPGKVPRRRINRGTKGRIALLHAIAHIELNAIDLACDMIVRFVPSEDLPDAFARDWIRVAADEARHFRLLNSRLADLGASYGDLPAHDGLWEAAENTAHNLRARLAIVPLVLEARGLDVTPMMVEKLRSVEDDESADILDVIHRDEITHVAAGQRWFQFLCARDGREPEAEFHYCVRHYFKGELKPPFNEVSRQAAGMPRAYYDVLET